MNRLDIRDDTHDNTTEQAATILRHDLDVLVDFLL